MIRLFPTVFALLMLVPASALCTPPTESVPAESPPRFVHDPKTELDMTGARVDGETSKPGAAGVTGRTASQWKPLLDLRADFDAEMVSSVQAIR